MSGTYNRTESYLDQDLDLDLDQDIVGREEHTKFIRNRRRLVLMSVVLIFLLTTVVMVTSVVYVELNKDLVGYLVRLRHHLTSDLTLQECPENDSVCIDHSCPVGWSLNPEDHCIKKAGESLLKVSLTLFLFT